MAETTYDRHGGGDNDVAVMGLVRQRAITERLLLAALDARDVSSEALAASRRATFLASASRELAMSLNGLGTREAIRRRSLMREGSWCIADVVEQDGAVHRLAIVHPDASKQELAQNLADRWFPMQAGFAADAGPAWVIDANATRGFTALRELGFGGLLAVPLVVRTAVLGAITFVTREGDAPFSPHEVALASDLADLCALALENERLYRQAHHLRAAADAANLAKSAFLGNMSHELMTPLNAIGGYVTLLEMGLRGPVTAEQLVDLNRIRHNQTHLLTLISEMLTQVRSEHGRLEYRFAEVSAQAAVHEVADMLQGAAEERHLLLLHPADDTDAFMWADAERVRQILMNLVMNAVKYATAERGQITLSVTTAPHTLAIHVADNGPGIPEEKLEVIFSPFVQLATGLTDRRGGVGLGLAISRELARGMNGELTVQSTVGVGSRFTLELPRADSADASTRSTSSPSPAIGRQQV
ncbi:MAG TPA: HAMP domain-containing sensor histidine kinase [Gemmatimonadaceae bacterium]